MSIPHFLDNVTGAIKAKLPDVFAARNERETKADGSYVTQADLLLQDVILQQIKQSLPEAQIVSEEMPVTEETSANGTIIVVDPIDGTENFTSGLPEWGVSIACFSKEKHVASLLGCPEMNVWLQTGMPVLRFQSRIHGLSSSLNKDDLIAASQGYEYRVLGCCVYNMINVIRGSFKSFENPKGASCWDILAGLNLALEHGLRVTVNEKSYAGQYLPPTQKYRFKVENR